MYIYIHIYIYIYRRRTNPEPTIFSTSLSLSSFHCLILILRFSPPLFLLTLCFFHSSFPTFPPCVCLTFSFFFSFFMHTSPTLRLLLLYAIRRVECRDCYCSYYTSGDIILTNNVVPLLGYPLCCVLSKSER